MYGKIVIIFALIYLGSWTIYANELEKSFNVLISKCEPKAFVINLNDTQEKFGQVLNKLSLRQLDQLKFQETDTKKIMIWNYLRILFPYKMPKTDLTRFNFMECYLHFDKFTHLFSQVDNSKWQVCIKALYKVELPEFEKQLFKCADQLVVNPVTPTP